MSPDQRLIGYGYGIASGVMLVGIFQADVQVCAAGAAVAATIATGQLMAHAITGDHVVVFAYGPDENYQFEVSGETDADELNIAWTKIELEPAQVEEILDEIVTYTEQCEDLAGKEYELQVRGGHRHPKGTPIHTESAEEVSGDA